MQADAKLQGVPQVGVLRATGAVSSAADAQYDGCWIVQQVEHAMLTRPAWCRPMPNCSECLRMVSCAQHGAINSSESIDTCLCSYQKQSAPSMQDYDSEGACERVCTKLLSSSSLQHLRALNSP